MTTTRIPDRIHTIAASFVILMAIVGGGLSIAGGEWSTLIWQAIAATGFAIAIVQQRRASALHAFLETSR
jgi:hypothetical protein